MRHDKNFIPLALYGHQDKKLDLIDWLINLEDETLIEQLNQIKKNRFAERYANFPEVARTSIERGLKDARNGNLISHEEGLRKHEKGSILKNENRLVI